MKLAYKNKNLEKACTDGSYARKKYGHDNAVKIHLRVDQIRASESVEFMIENHIGRCHRLQGNRSGQYAVDLEHPYRLIFSVNGEQIQIAKIEEIAD